MMCHQIETGAGAASRILFTRGDSIQVAFGIGGIVYHCQRVQITRIGLQGDLAIAE
jgi:hypothetical protein